MMPTPDGAPKTSEAFVGWVDKQARYMRAENQDVILPITGPEGSGKSTLGLIILLVADRSFSVETLPNRLSWQGDTHIRLCQQAPRYAGLQLDEGEGIIAQDAMTGMNRLVKKHLYRCRKLNLWQNFLMPEWDAVQNVLSDWRSNWRIEVEKKGEATLKRQNDKGHWGKHMEFSFPPLDGTELWEAYEDLAERASRGEDVHETDTSEPQVSSFERLVRDLESELEPLGEVARQTAEHEDGTPWTPSNAKA